MALNFPTFRRAWSALRLYTDGLKVEGEWPTWLTATGINTTDAGFVLVMYVVPDRLGWAKNSLPTTLDGFRTEIVARSL